jgi:Uma2 family endonuclease
VTDLITRSDATPVQLSPTAVRWTRQNCEALEAAGILNYRYELVDGVINDMSQNIRHGILVRLILEWLFAAFGGKFILTQVTIDVRPEENPTNAPEPDAIVLARPAEDLTANPIPSDIRLCIEAADTTLAYDLTTKAHLYARAGISEYWVVNVPHRKLHVHRRPEEVIYREVTVYDETEYVSPLATKDAVVHVNSLLPQRPQATSE